MKRLVYVAYFFPPTGGAGVQRTVKFVRYLSDQGWVTTVVTPKSPRYWMQDESLSQEIPENVLVLRTRAWTGHAFLGAVRAHRAEGDRNAVRSGHFQRRLRGASSWLLLPDAFVGWVPFAARAATSALRRGGVLVTTSSPDSSHLVGLCMRRPGVGWVADFRDPWTRRMSYHPSTPLHHRLHSLLEGRVVARADRLVVTSEATRRDFLARYPDLAPGRIVCITNGYDEEDFPVPEPQPDRAFLLLHLGQLNPERPVGPLLDHLDAFFDLRPEARSRTRVELVGPRYQEDEREVARRGYSDVVRFLDSLPHRQAVSRLFKARVLVLMEQESERGALILPGKIFEYLRTSRPIFGILPDGAAADLIRKLGAGVSVPSSQPKAGGRAIAQMFDRYAAGSLPAERTNESRINVRMFERKHLATRLSELLQEVARETQ